MVPDLWTERLAGPFLGGSVVVYLGCPNVYRNFPKYAVVRLDLIGIQLLAPRAYALATLGAIPHLVPVQLIVIGNASAKPRSQAEKARIVGGIEDVRPNALYSAIRLP